MLLGLLVVSALGGVLYQQIARGLESDKVDTSQSEALALTAQVLAELAIDRHRKRAALETTFRKFGF